MKKFIHVSDNETASKLIELGFQQIPSFDGSYAFLSRNEINFSSDEIDQSKLYYTDILSV